jgi:hypothetical protein
LTYATDFRASASGDATWPNQATGKNLPALDIVGSGVSTDGTSLTARIDLADTSSAGFVRDLGAYNAVTTTDLAATRLQYVARWDFKGETYYLAAEVDSSGGATYYGGKVDSSSVLSNGNSAVGVSYRPQSAFTVTGKISANSLLISGKLSDFGAAAGSTLVSYGSFSLAGPADALISGQPTSAQIFASMRTVDSSPTMDAVLAAAPPANVPESPWVVLLLGAAVLTAALFSRRRLLRRRNA